MAGAVRTKPSLDKSPMSGSAKIRDPKFLGSFIVGAEFELYVSAPERRMPDLPRQIPPEIMAKYGHLISPRPPSRDSASFSHADAKALVLSRLREDWPLVEWGRMLSFTSDSSLTSARLGQGIEIVLKHSSGPAAMKAIGQMLKTFGRMTEIRTDKSAGFHLNASFKRAALNHPDVFFEVPSFVPHEEIKKLFGRKDCEYCESNGEAEIDVDEMFYDNDLFSMLMKASDQRAPRGGSMTFDALAAAVSDFSKPKSMEAFSKLVIAAAKKTVLDEWCAVRPACAPRLSTSSKASPLNYMEFRMMGGDSYHLRPRDLAASIQSCLEGMRKAAAAFEASARAGKPRAKGISR